MGFYDFGVGLGFGARGFQSFTGIRKNQREAFVVAGVTTECEEVKKKESRVQRFGGSRASRLTSRFSRFPVMN